MTRILITGSRLWTDAAVIHDALAKAIAEHPGPVTIVHGEARGADELADAIAPTFGAYVTTERWPAQWNGPCRPTCNHKGRVQRPSGTTFCPAAGGYRNQAMVDAGADLCLAFPVGPSVGTRDCMRRAAGAGIPVIDHDPNRSAAASRPEPTGA